MDVIPDIAWAILLLLLGLALAVLEVFVPSGGIIAILSAVALIAALVMAFQESATTGPMIGFVFAAVTVFADVVLSEALSAQVAAGRGRQLTPGARVAVPATIRGNTARYSIEVDLAEMAVTDQKK